MQAPGLRGPARADRGGSGHRRGDAPGLRGRPGRGQGHQPARRRGPDAGRRRAEPRHGADGGAPVRRQRAAHQPEPARLPQAHRGRPARTSRRSSSRCPSPAGPFGARGVGEPPIVPAPAAIANAIHDATGVRSDRAADHARSASRWPWSTASTERSTADGHALAVRGSDPARPRPGRRRPRPRPGAQALGHGARPRGAPHARRGSPGRGLLGHGAGLRGGPVPARTISRSTCGRWRAARARAASSPPATGLDAGERRLVLDGRPPIAYDTVSFDVGSQVAGLELPGVARARAPHAADRALRPRRGRRCWPRARGASAARVVVVGAGAGGVELAFALARAARARGRRTRRGAPARGRPRACCRATRRARRPASSARPRRAASRSARASRVDARSRPGAVHLEGGERFRPTRSSGWRAPPAPPLFAGSRPRDRRGRLRARPPDAAVRGARRALRRRRLRGADRGPGLAKAGVYAVRQGPVLDAQPVARSSRRAAPRATARSATSSRC